MKPIPLAMFLLGACLTGMAADIPREKAGRPGLKRIELVTDITSVTPGTPFTVALLIEPLPGYHTYWKGPGIVGVATTFEWSLSRGFSAGETIWPPPTKVLMAGITAYGYRSKTLLLAEIQTPEEISDPEVVIGLKSAWMVCALECNPGVDDFSLVLPVNQTSEQPDKNESLSRAFEEVRQSAPRPAPPSWKIVPRSPAPERIELDITMPNFDPDSAPSLYFFSHDMQVDSDEPQSVEVIDAKQGRVRLSLSRPDFAPRSPARISGVLHFSDGWPELDSHYVEISALWPDGTFAE